MKLRRPKEGEYSSYYQAYVDQVESDDFLSVLKNSKEETFSFFNKIPLEKWEYKYAPEKWTIKETIIHLLDTERVFAYRAMCISRNDKTHLPGFDQNEYVPNSNANNRTSESIVKEYVALRNSTIHLFQHFTSEQLDRMGTGSGHPISVLGLGFIIAGHELHHKKIIRERYL